MSEGSRWSCAPKLGGECSISYDLGAVRDLSQLRLGMYENGVACCYAIAPSVSLATGIFRLPTSLCNPPCKPREEWYCCSLEIVAYVAGETRELISMYYCCYMHPAICLCLRPVFPFSFLVGRP